MGYTDNPGSDHENRRWTQFTSSPYLYCANVAEHAHNTLPHKSIAEVVRTYRAVCP